MPVIAGSPFLDNHLGEACWLVFPFLNDFFSNQGLPFQGILSRRAGRSRTLSLSFGFSLIIWIMCSFHTFLLERIYLLLSIVHILSTVSFSLPRPTFGCRSARGGLFKLSFMKRHAAHEFSVRGTHHRF